VGTLACAMLLKMSILKMSSNTEIREKGECAAVRAVGQGLWYREERINIFCLTTYVTDYRYVLDCLLFAYHTIINTNVLHGLAHMIPICFECICLLTNKRNLLMPSKSKRTKINHKCARG